MPFQLPSELWKNSQWIKLGQYEKSVWGTYQSAFYKGYFIAEDGATSPESELKATVQLLYFADADTLKTYKNHPQCIYPARTRWLNQVLNISKNLIQNCEYRKLWKAQLNVTSVSVIFAASDFGNASSSFGHTFLKFNNPENIKNKELLDYGVDYSAQTDGANSLLYSLKGLTGFYDGRIALLPYHQKLREYINLEGRDIWEYHLNFTANEVDFLIDYLLELENARAPYYFFSDNCSYRVLKILEAVRPDTNLSEQFKYFVIPIDTLKKIARDTLWIDHISYKKSLKSDYLESYESLSEKQKAAVLDITKALGKPTLLSSLAFNSLKPLEKAETLETASKYLALKAYKTEENFENEKYELASERALIGGVTLVRTNQQIKSAEKSHDSSALSFKLVQEKNSTNYAFKFRNALHELEQKDEGYVPFSHTEMLSAQFKYFSETREVRFDELTLLKLVNLNPSSSIDKNLAWKIDLKALAKGYLLEGGVGGALQNVLLPSSRSAFLLTALVQTDNLYLGPHFLYVFDINSNLRASVEVQHFSLLNSEAAEPTELLKVFQKINYQLNSTADLQFGAFYSTAQSQANQFVFELGYTYNFIF